MVTPAPMRTRLAARVGRVASEASRRTRAGGGSVIGGRVLLRLDPRALERLASGRQICLVSGTNGKTTTTHLLAAALATHGAVITNAEGANLMSGLALSLAEGGDAGIAVLEVDEGFLPHAVDRLHPVVVTLLNLSRDQLDRIAETRVHAESWRSALERSPSTAVVANADDPLVVWAARAATDVTWVATGQRWRLDAYACPACGERIVWHPPKVEDRARAAGADSEAWRCSTGDLVRPTPQFVLEDDHVVLPDGTRSELDLQLPGWPNRANAVMAAAAAHAAGIDPVAALAAMAAVTDIEGRYQVVNVDGVRVRLLLAKNPAGWAEAIELLRPGPIVIGINDRVADGRDPSWLWDVPFERLRGRLVVASGDRGSDLAVRLRYAEVEHRHIAGYPEAVAAAAAANGAVDIDLAANYTAFQDARAALG